MLKGQALASLLLLLLTLGCSLAAPTPTPPPATLPPEPTSTPEASAGLANPASTYCLDQGGTLEIRNTDEGQVGYCTLPDGTVCEEWAFYRGECPAPATAQPTATEPSGILFTMEGVSFRYPPSLAAGFIGSQLPANEEGGPGMPAQPAHILITAQGYRIGYHRWQPQIAIYPVDPAYPQLTGNNAALMTLLATHPTDVEHSALPFYPPTNAGILFHARLHYLDFQDGSGVAYLAQLGQAYGAISNYDLLYVFQGVTSDGTTYVSAFLPLNAPGLVDQAEAPPEDDPRFQGDFDAYARQVAAELDALDEAAFTPTLSEIEELLHSLDVH